MKTQGMLGIAGADKTMSLEARLDRLENLEGIRNLMKMYAVFADEEDADGFASLFTEDAVWDSNRFGSYSGRDQIRVFMQGIPTVMSWAMHFMTSPLIDVDGSGEKATGRWYLLELATMLQGDQVTLKESVLITCKYYTTLRSVNGRWLFERVNAQFETVADWSGGWAETPFRP